MKREELSTIFPEATKEQIDKIMDINGADIKHARNGVEDLKKELKEANAMVESMKAGAEELERLKGVEDELTELKNANSIREMREKVSKETGVPVNLLTGDTEEDCTKWANALKEYKKPSTYPDVRNDGEQGNHGHVPTTAEQFAEWSETII